MFALRWWRTFSLSRSLTVFSYCAVLSSDIRSLFCNCEIKSSWLCNSLLTFSNCNNNQHQQLCRSSMKIPTIWSMSLVEVLQSAYCYRWSYSYITSVPAFQPAAISKLRLLEANAPESYIASIDSQVLIAKFQTEVFIILLLAVYPFALALGEH